MGLCLYISTRSLNINTISYSTLFAQLIPCFKQLQYKLNFVQILIDFCSLGAFKATTTSYGGDEGSCGGCKINLVHSTAGWAAAATPQSMQVNFHFEPDFIDKRLFSTLTLRSKSPFRVLLFKQTCLIVQSAGVICIFQSANGCWATSSLIEICFFAIFQLFT